MPKKPAKPDVNATVVAHVLAATGSEPVDGESLLDTPELRRQFREAKAAEIERAASSAGKGANRK